MIPVLSTHIEPSVLGSDASDHQRAVGIQTHPGGLGQLLDHLPQVHHCGILAGCLKVPGCARAGGGGGGWGATGQQRDTSSSSVDMTQISNNAWKKCILLTETWSDPPQSTHRTDAFTLLYWKCALGRWTALLSRRWIDLSYIEDRIKPRRTFKVKHQHQTCCQGEHFQSLFLPDRCSSIHLGESGGILQLAQPSDLPEAERPVLCKEMFELPLCNCSSEKPRKKGSGHERFKNKLVQVSPESWVHAQVARVCLQGQGGAAWRTRSGEGDSVHSKR